MQVYKLTNELETPMGEKKIHMWKLKLDTVKREVALRMSDEYQKSTGAMEFSYMLKKYKVHHSKKSNIPEGGCSNAFYKMWEIMNWLNFDQKVITGDTVHFDNAAFPGDFIRAVKYYFDDITPYDSSWFGNSLLPQGDTKVLGDRYSLYRDYPNRWVMDTDMGINGDVRDLDMVNKISIMLSDENVNLYTSDLGIPFKDRFNEEGEHIEANIGQVILGLKVLQPGGVFVVKMFGMYSDIVRQLVSFVASLFESAYILKPKTSKPDNSEVYLCGINYNGFTGDISAQNMLDVKKIKLSNIIPEITYSQINKLRDNIKKFDNKWKYGAFPYSTITSWLHNEKLIYSESDAKERKGK